MKIAVIGAGRIGGTIGGAWERAGHDVVYGLRDPAKKSGARPIAAALDGAEAVLLAIPGNAVVQLVRENAKQLGGKIVIDATNSFGGDESHQWAAMVAAAPRVQLYRTFNSYGFDVFADPKLGGEIPDMFYAGPKGAGRGTVEKLIEDVGLRPIWVGDASAVDVVDGVLRLWFALSKQRGRRIAFKLISD